MTEPKPIRRWLVIVVASVATAILLSLSYWQYSKIGPKDAKIALIKERMAAPPAPLPVAAVDLEDWRYRPALLTGRYRADMARHVYRAGPKGGPGYHLLVPLVPDAGTAVWVDLGWFPETQKPNFESPPIGAETTQLSGQVFPRQRNARLVTPAPPDEAANRYYRIQPEALGAGSGLTAAEDFYLIASQPLHGLTAAPPPVKLEHNHRSYAFQWLAMAIGLVVIAGAFVRRR